MLIKLALFVAVVGGVILWVSPQARAWLRPRLPILLLYGGIALLLLLVVTGRLSWIGAAIAAALALLRRVAPLLLHLGQATRMFGFSTSGVGADSQGTRENPGTDEPMSRANALAILGLNEGADREAVLAAHRRLMQRCHPDRGGSDYLAARLNEARDCLLQG